MPSLSSEILTCYQLCPENSHCPMYTINVKPLSDIKPLMHTDGFDIRHGDLGTAAIVLAEIGVVHTIQSKPILLGRVKESLR